QRPILRRASVVHHRLDAEQRQRYSHRRTQLRRVAENDRPPAERRLGNSRNRRPWQPRRQPRLRRDASAPRHRLHHRTRYLCRDARRPFVPLSRRHKEMKSRWSDSDAQAAIKHYAEKGVGEDLALRTYTTRLLGGDPKLVLHGGGNTSVKTKMKDLLGDDVDVICVKGSGWDMGNIEPPGLPAVRLAPLRRLRALAKLSDEDMVNYQRVNLLDSTAPNPSVETLLHAFLPHKFIDHTHSTAVLAITDQPDGEAIARDVFGKRVAYVPYTIPGFALAKSVADIFDKNPDVEGLVLLRHGIFTFADDAKTAYERMIEFVTMAEQRLATDKKPLKQATLPKTLASVADIAPILRGRLAIARDAMAGTVKRQILDFRTSPAILNYVNGTELWRYSQQGVVTPDHNIRTKNLPLIVPAPEAGKLDQWTK